ncbi:MAG: PAS domain S-box protein [Nitrospirota bacterium]|nr:PAS domain S-box protein [Nitrospirota bacterium]
MNEERRINEELKAELEQLRKRARYLEQERGKMQETLTDAEERCQLICENSPIGMGFINLDGVLVDCNDALSSIIGTPRDRLIGFPMKTGLTNEAVAVALARAFAGRTGAFEGEYAGVTSGKTTSLRAIFSPLFSRDGMLRGVLFLAEDISERKQMEESLRQSEERYRQLFEAESDALFLIDNETGRILMANAAAAAMYGFSEAELREKKNTDLSAEPSETRRVTEETPVLKDAAVTIPLRYHRKRDGAVFPVEITGRFFDYKGRPVHIAAIRDISERKRAEEQLKESEEKYKFLIEATRTGFVIINGEGRVLDANDEYVRLSGHAKQEDILGRGVVEWTAAHDRERNAEEVKKCVETGFVQNLEVDYVHENGRISPVEINATAMRTGGAIRIFTICRDITERKRAEEALRDSRRFLEEIIESAPT